MLEPADPPPVPVGDRHDRGWATIYKPDHTRTAEANLLDNGIADTFVFIVATELVTILLQDNII
jgi:hypothetical protein